MTTQAMLQGTFATGAIKHALTTGVSTLNRRDNFADYLFDFVGFGNIYNPVYYNYQLGATNPVRLRRKDDEKSVFVQDILTLSDRLKLHTGVRYTQLPNVAVVYNVQPTVSVYGSYSEGLEPGGEAPAGSTNVDMVMDPTKSKQYEVGVKADLNADISVSAAIFQIKRANEYVNSSFTYAVAGKQVNRGLELAAQGRATRDLMIGASFTALQAKAEGTGDYQIEGKRIGNVPKFKSAIYMDYALPQMPAIKLNAMWIYSGSKAFAPNRDIAVLNKEVDGYHVLNLGARYATKFGNTATTFRFGVDNVFNKFYWGDTSNAFGGYLIPGAPRVFRLSTQLDF
jgi:iron complex outermembrane receptor protein